jgi:hypothetical protein
MSWTDVSKMLGQELNLPVVKSDQPLRLWCLAAKGYTDLEINPLSAKQAWQDAQAIAHQLGESQWEARERRVQKARTPVDAISCSKFEKHRVHEPMAAFFSSSPIVLVAAFKLVPATT